ncbi:unnamed protein product [Arctogadus glacialis]
MWAARELAVMPHSKQPAYKRTTVVRWRVWNSHIQSCDIIADVLHGLRKRLEINSPRSSLHPIPQPGH